MRAHWALLLLTMACKKPGSDIDPDDTEVEEEQGPAPDLIPAPAFAYGREGVFVFDESTRISAEGDALVVAEGFAESLRTPTGLPLEMSDEGEISLSIDPELELAAEGYVLDVRASEIRIVGKDAAGLFYGTQTLKMLLPPQAVDNQPNGGVSWEVGGVHIEDAPRFAWRGLMIDVARHFFDKEVILKQIDAMALYKMNRLHLHLTDDQGWRIEIESWPLLTEIGGSTEVGGGEGGWYTQADYAEIVEYAAERHIVVVPEIDFPGHAHAAMASYGELNPGGEPEDLYTDQWVISTSIWLDGPVTDDFVADVWGEIAAITPGPWVHIGGDEAINTPENDYGDFVVWLQDLVGASNKTMIGWDEIGTVDLEGEFVAQHWFDENQALDAVQRGGGLISSPAEHTYLDMIQEEGDDQGQTWAGIVDLEAAYHWDPVLQGAEESSVLGVEGALWTEFVDTEVRMDRMLWPRAVALAEVGWSQENQRTWGGFRERVAKEGPRLDALNLDYFPSAVVDWE